MADHDRPLAAIGSQQATRMGQHIAGRHGAPNLILSSTARRAAETAALAAAEFGSPPGVDHERGLYACGSDALIRRLHAVAPEFDTVMIVAHNPDLHEMAILLAGTGEAAQLAGLRRKFPTGALAVLTFNVPTWAAVHTGQGRLDEFVVPGDLV